MGAADDAARDARGRTDAITKIVTVTVAPEHEAELVAYAEQLVARVHANEPATLLYVVTKHPDRPHTYVWIERYENEAALKAHAQQPYVVEAVDTVSGWWVTDPEVLQLSQIAPT
jgi:quinol monooxygenase YgiN